VWTNGSGTNSVKPPVSSCSRREQLQVGDPVVGWSTWPYIIVLVVGMPSRWAVVTTSTQDAVGSLPLVSTHRTSSSRISAAVPGQAVDPASRTETRNSAIDSDERAAPLTTSIGL
jgi:hypothetical protein